MQRFLQNLVSLPFTVPKLMGKNTFSAAKSALKDISRRKEKPNKSTIGYIRKGVKNRKNLRGDG
jgi:hypothetical protein